MKVFLNTCNYGSLLVKFRPPFISYLGLGHKMGHICNDHQ